MAGVAPGSLSHLQNGTRRGHDGFIEGAMTTMLLFKRVAALARTIEFGRITRVPKSEVERLKEAFA